MKVVGGGHDVHDIAVIAPQHTAVVVELHAGDRRGRAVHEARRALPEEVVLPVGAHRAHDVVTGVHLGHELRNLLRRVLEVRVERDHVLAVRGGEGRHDRHVLARVAHELHRLHQTRVGRRRSPQDLERAVPGAIVHEDDLEGPSESLEHGKEPREKHGEISVLVEDRNDDRDLPRDERRGRHARHSRGQKSVPLPKKQ
jgi:hypothetical protein